MDSARDCLEADLLDALYPPLIMVEPQEWKTQERKVLIVGQETQEWSYISDAGERAEIDFLKDALGDLNSVDRLAKRYVHFDLGDEYPSLARTPFWRAHRQIANTLCHGDKYAVLWTNISPVSIWRERGSFSMVWNLSEKERKSISTWQQGRLLGEILELKPDVVVFFTGPNYDEYLEREFLGVQFENFWRDEIRTIAKLTHSFLPSKSFRTYHPAFLSRSRQWEIVDTLIEDVLAS